LGGILVRYVQSHDPIPDLGRVVMLGPPNQGRVASSCSARQTRAVRS
jgi:hypothetical protein